MVRAKESKVENLNTFPYHFLVMDLIFLAMIIDSIFSSSYIEGESVEKSSVKVFPHEPVNFGFEFPEFTLLS